MGIGVSIFLIAVGAILTWAVNATVSGLELNTIGVILMVVGALGLVLSMIFWSSWGGFARRRAPDDDLRRRRAARLGTQSSSVFRSSERRPRAASSRSRERQLERERRAAAGLRLDADPAAHPPDELARDVEAEAGAADTAREVRVEPEELLEDPLLLGGRDPETAVAHREADASVDLLAARARRGRRSAST